MLVQLLAEPISLNKTQNLVVVINNADPLSRKADIAEMTAMFPDPGVRPR